MRGPAAGDQILQLRSFVLSVLCVHLIQCKFLLTISDRTEAEADEREGKEE